MKQATGTLFRYRGRTIFGPWDNEVWAIFATIVPNTLVALFVVFVIPTLPPITFLIALGITISFIVIWNPLTFAKLLEKSNIELTTEQVFIHISPHWRLSIDLCKLEGSVQIRKFVMPVRVRVGPVFKLRDVYLVSSPNLPWYFRCAGLPFMLAVRGFIITSWHANYEAFLDKMRVYGAQ